ncbi:hypothetical protein F5Y18DRAFT_109420 [Xylariaceae sp. FL1019]|nr:hypothetical protein F5Y18DRAFT_109420 [Xylariaceae sp. FL1019]
MSVATLSDSAKKQALLKYDAIREQELSSNTAVQDFIQTTKSQLLFQHNWSELVGAAPLALNLIGSCYIACSVSRATEITLDRPASGDFQRLHYESLRACMVECGDIGLDAFRNMGPRMNRIVLISKTLYKDVNIVTQCLSAGPEATSQLKMTLASMKSQAKECSGKAAEVDKDFSNWLAYIEELHHCCLAKETSNTKQRTANATQLAAKQAQLEVNKNAAAEAKKVMGDLGETLTVTREAYKKASDEFPKGSYLRPYQSDPY